MDKNFVSNLSTIITQTMCDSFEFIDISKEDIIKIFNKEKVDGITEKEYRTIFQFYKAFIETLSKPQKLVFNDILLINEIVEYKIGYYNGVFANEVRLVAGFDEMNYHIPVQNQQEQENNFDILINILDNTSNVETKIELILEFFIEQITNQWFHNGNKRTSLITCNKLLLDYCCENQNNLLISFDKELFTPLMATYYAVKYNYPLPQEILDYFEGIPTKEVVKQELIMFLKESVYKNKQENINIKHIFLEQCKNFLGLNFNITANEIQKLTTHNVIRTTNKEIEKLATFKVDKTNIKKDIKEQAKNLTKGFTFSR